MILWFHGLALGSYQTAMIRKAVERVVYVKYRKLLIITNNYYFIFLFHVNNHSHLNFNLATRLVLPDTRNKTPDSNISLDQARADSDVLFHFTMS